MGSMARVTLGAQLSRKTYARALYFLRGTRSCIWRVVVSEIAWATIVMCASFSFGKP